MLIFWILIVAVPIVALLTLRSNRTAELREFGVTKELQEAARTVEPNLDAPEPEEYV